MHLLHAPRSQLPQSQCVGWRGKHGSMCCNVRQGSAAAYHAFEGVLVSCVSALQQV
jgi:hypothetical protein